MATSQVLVQVSNTPSKGRKAVWIKEKPLDFHPNKRDLARDLLECLTDSDWEDQIKRDKEFYFFNKY